MAVYGRPDMIDLSKIPGNWSYDTRITQKINPRLGFVLGGTPTAALANDPSYNRASLPTVNYEDPPADPNGDSWGLAIVAAVILAILLLLKTVLGVFR